MKEIHKIYFRQKAISGRKTEIEEEMNSGHRELGSIYILTT